jgi:selenocysteine-specific elongation factor
MLLTASAPVKVTRVGAVRGRAEEGRALHQPETAPAPRIVGTAGHIDHGKSRLVFALSGIDPDRLPEEKARGITIDLGFAPFRLPDGTRAAFVDVPGHERFVRTMVAGASGIDLALVVIAADEGPMPQTLEHLAILDLLGVERAVVALTKVDLVDADWLELVSAECRRTLAQTPYRDAPLVAVSAVRGDGLERLRDTLAAALSDLPPRPEEGPARLAVDRVFSRSGFGTVVTGTLASGRVAREDRLRLYPADREVRVRAVEVHGERRDAARAGERTALNLGGVERDEVRRGDVVASVGAVTVTRVVAADLTLLAAAPRLRSGRSVHVHAGTAQTTARLVWLDADAVDGGERARPARLHLRQPLALAAGDRLIVRGATPLTTLGGGVVLDPRGDAYRRGRPASLAALRAMRDGGERARLAAALARAGRTPADEVALARTSGLGEEAVRAGLRTLAAEGAAVVLAGGGWLAADAWRAVEAAVAETLVAYHRDHPLRPGAPREEVRRRAAPTLDGRRFALAVKGWETAGWLRVERDRLALADFRPAATDAARAAVDKVAERLRQGGLAPPTAAEALADVADADEVLALLVADGRVVRLGDGLYLHRDAVAAARTVLERLLAADGAVGAAQFRDALGVSRRLAVPLLEHFDAIRVTRRQGDLHVAAAATRRPEGGA